MRVTDQDRDAVLAHALAAMQRELPELLPSVVSDGLAATLAPQVAVMAANIVRTAGNLHRVRWGGGGVRRCGMAGLSRTAAPGGG